MLNRPDAGRCLAMALLALIAVGCGRVLEPEQDEHTLSRARWASTNTNDYVFDLQRSCFCVSDFVRPVRIEILGGIVNSAVYTDTGELISPPLTSVPTIEDLFDEIREALDGSAFSVIADYHPGMGYPINVSIDYIENAIDDEMAFSVSSFQLLDVSGS